MSRKCPVNPYTDEFKSIADAAYWWNKRADTNESIVHCKDCKYLACTISSNHFMYFPTNDYECGKAIFDGYVNPEDFCSRGERRE